MIRSCNRSIVQSSQRVEALASLSKLPLVVSLPERARRVVLDRTHVTSFRRGDVVAWEGGSFDRLLVPIEGFLKLSVSRLDGRRRVTGVIGKGATPCWWSVLAGEPMPVSLIGLQDGILAELPPWPFRYGVSNHADFAYVYASEVARWAASLQAQIVATRAATVAERMAGLLLYLLEQCGDPNTGSISAYLSRQELAEAAGTTEETTIRILGKWTKAGQLETVGRSRFLIKNPDWLRKVADGIAPAIETT